MMDPLLYKAARSGDITFLQTLTADEETRFFSQLTPNSNTLLHIAAEFKQAEFFKKVCLKCNPSQIWQPNSKHETPLHVAARAGCIKIIRFLIEQASISPYVQGGRQHNVIRKKNKAGDTALHCAVRYGQYNVVEFLLRKDPVLSSFCNYSDESPLYIAVANHFIGIAFLIIDLSPFSYSHTGPKGLTPLHEAVNYRSAFKLIEELVEQRQEMMKEADAILGWTPFHYAAFLGGVEGLKLLLKYDINSSAAYLLDHDGNSVLHVGASEGRINVVKELIENCPDIFELTNKKGQTALHVAVLKGKVKIVEYILGNLQISGLLNEADEDGNTPLHLAVLFDQKPIIELLAKDLRVDVNARNKDFKTPTDIYFLSFREAGFKDAKIASLLNGTSYTSYTQHWVSNVSKGLLNGTSQLKPYLSGLREHNERFKNSYLKYPEVFLVVATLVTTISFSAAFTVPGGYKTDGIEKGKPILADKLAFKAFVIFDIVSFLSSLSAVFFQSGTAFGERARARYQLFQLVSLLMAIVALALAFASGIYVTLANSSLGLAIAPYVMLCFLLFLYCACRTIDPFGGNHRIVKTWAIGKYHFRMKCGGPAGRLLPTFTYHIYGQKKRR